ncbi:MFS transporter [Piscirickettsia salmonis]|uniref:MFS transporter n=1 Tax=Piscirickettsia salmonis TaxID=1238 RepID=UPI003A80964F
MSNNINNRNKKWWILVGTAISGFMIGIDYTIVNMAIASIQTELTVNTNQLQWLMSGFGITFCAFLASMGKLADIIGRRRLLFRKRRYLGRYFAPPMMQNRRAKRDDYKPSAALVTGHYVP